MLKQRIITALILLPIALCGFFLLEGSNFALFIGLVVTLGAWEWARLAGFTAQAARVGFAVIVALLLFCLHLLPDLAPWVLAAAVVWWALATFLVLTFPHLSRFRVTLVQYCSQAGNRLADLATGLARVGHDQGHGAGQLADHGGDGVGVGGRHRRLLFRA